jgi:hypothetical protein
MPIDNSLVQFYLDYFELLIGIKDIDLTYTTYFEKRGNNIVLCFGYHDRENCYKKIEN